MGFARPNAPQVTNIDLNGLCLSDPNERNRPMENREHFGALTDRMQAFRVLLVFLLSDLKKVLNFYSLSQHSRTALLEIRGPFFRQV